MKLKKRITVLIAVLLLLALLTGCAQQAAAPVAEASNAPAAEQQAPVTEAASTENTGEEAIEPVKYALITSITGGNAQLGYYQQAGAEFMTKKINEEGGIKSLGGAKIELVIGDHQSDATLIQSVAERILEDEDVLAVTGAGTSSYAMSLLPTTEKYQVCLLTANCAESIVQSGYEYVVQSSALAAETGATQVEFLKYLSDVYNYDTNKVAVIYTDNDYGVSTSASSKELAESAGFDVVYYESFPTDLSDASSLVMGMKASGAQAVFMTSEASNTKLIIDAMRSMNYGPVVLGGGSGFTVQSFADELGDSVIGICSTSEFGFDSTNIKNNPELEAYINEFYNEYGFYPTEGCLYEMAHLLIFRDAMERCGSRDRTVIKDAIRATSLEVFNPGGIMEFHEDGSAKNSIMVIDQWQKNEETGIYEFRCVYPAEYATREFLDQR